MKLVKAEGQAVGGIGFATYSDYIKAAGGWALSILAIIVTSLASGAQTFADYWLSIWIDNLPSSESGVILDSFQLYFLYHIQRYSWIRLMDFDKIQSFLYLTRTKTSCFFE